MIAKAHNKEGYRILTGTENPVNIQTSEDNISESAESASNEASPANKSAELVDYRHGEFVRQVYNIADIREMQNSVKCLKFITSFNDIIS